MVSQQHAAKLAVARTVPNLRERLRESVAQDKVADFRVVGADERHEAAGQYITVGGDVAESSGAVALAPRTTGANFGAHHVDW